MLSGYKRLGLGSSRRLTSRSAFHLGICALVVAGIDVGCSASSDDGSNDGLPLTPANCNNGLLDPGEDCDGLLLGNGTCASATMGVLPAGQLKCTATCKYDATVCTSGVGAGGAPNIAGAPNYAGTPNALSGGGPNSLGGAPAATGGGPGVGGGSMGGDGNVGAGGAVTTSDPVIPAVTETCPTWTNGTITFMGLGGIQIAAGAKPPGPTAPMLVYWHGTGSTSGEYGFMDAAVANGVTGQGGVIVSFQNTTGGDLNSGTNIFGVGDLKLVDQLVGCAVKDHNIDPHRIFAAGCSAGGLFSTAMGAMRSSYVAAVAPNSGGSVVPAQFDSTHTPALMTRHGKAGSDVVGVDFSQTSATADKAFKTHGGFVIDCDTGAGHCGASGLSGDAWKFFLAHPFGVAPEPYASGLPAGFSAQCKIVQ